MTVDNPMPEDDDSGRYEGMPDQELIEPLQFHPFIDTDAIRMELNILEELPDPDDVLTSMVNMISYMPQLCAELDRLYMVIRTERLRYANLRAGCLAAFSAENDGETDALSYVREEFFTNPAHNGRHWGRR